MRERKGGKYKSSSKIETVPDLDNGIAVIRGERHGNKGHIDHHKARVTTHVTERIGKAVSDRLDV